MEDGPMIELLRSWDPVGNLTWDHVLVVLAILAVARLLALVVRRFFRHLAERAPARLRLFILRASSLLRLALGLTALGIAIPVVIDPTPQNLIILIVGAGVAVAFTFKDYASSLVAGLVAIIENVYQPGDWIEIAGTYGEVKTISLRAVRLVTADDTEVVIPHPRLWYTSVANATSGQRSLLCVARFFLHPDHDASAVQQALEGVRADSPYRKAESAASIVVTEHPWGTEYKLKAYVRESREQFAFVTDLTVRGKAALRALGIRFAHAPVAVTEDR
jgi:small-conductance mechanosensitive channel